MPPLFLLTDDIRLPDPVAAVDRLPRGAAVIARAREARSLASLVATLAPICRRRGVRLIVAGDARLAFRHGADGVHLSEGMCRRRAVPAVPRRGRRLLLTAAAHSLPALLRAARRGAAAVLLSPAFATASHPDARPLGAMRVAAIVRAARRAGQSAAVVALGGIGPSNVARLRGTGVAGIAAIGALAGPKATG